MAKNDRINGARYLAMLALSHWEAVAEETGKASQAELAGALLTIIESRYLAETPFEAQAYREAERIFDGL